MALDAKHVFTTLSVCATALIGVQLIAQAGSLTPPGAPAPTMKTLDEVEARIPIGPLTTPGDADSLYKITQGGSYYLAGPVTGQLGKHGIEIDAGNVTLDLNGYAMTGGGADRLNAIEVTAVFGLNIEVRNGKIDSWTGAGINAPNTIGMRVSNIDVFITLNAPGFVLGSSTSISDCTASFTAGGFVVGEHSVVDRCVSEGASGTSDGFALRAGAVVSRSVAANGGNDGFVSFDPEGIGGNVFDDCVARNNAGAGIKTGPGATVRNCAAAGNGVGFSAGAGSLIVGCVAADNTGDGFSGFSVTIGSSVARENGSHGFDLGSKSRITGCNAIANGVIGIETDLTSVIESCFVSSNGGSGIVFDSGSVVRGNTVVDNNATFPGGGGIVTVSTGSRIEGNFVAGNNFGFEILNADNTLIQNQARSNSSSYGQVVVGNFVGAIVTTNSAMNAETNDKMNLSF